MSRATPEDPESPRVIDATPQRVPASATPKVISEWKKTDRDKQGAVADAPPSLGVSPSERPRTAPTAPSLGVSLSGRPRAVIRQGEPRDPGGSLRVRDMAQRAVVRPLHAGPPSRRPPPLQPSRRPSSR